jgi:hypothetical protein
MVHVNLLLWLAMVAAAFGAAPDGTTRWTAAAGLVTAALWEHSAVRGFLKPRRNIASDVPAAN